MRRATQEWASAVTDGWVDLTELTAIDYLDRPECGIDRCGARARWVDPSGAGWCDQHRDQGLHGEPPARTPAVGSRR